MTYPLQRDVWGITAKYLGPLVLQRSIEAVKGRTGDDAEYIVAKDYTVSWAGETDFGVPVHGTVTVPAGLATDLASVPRFFHRIVNRVGPHLEASVVHDYLYVAWQDNPFAQPQRKDRRFADRLFLALMREARVPAWKRTAIYLAVRAFGWRAYSSPDPGRYVKL